MPILLRHSAPSAQGNGVLIDDQGLILTIGYLILEATGINIVCKGSIVPASIVGYDNQSGFGLVRTVRPLDARPIEIGSSAALQEHESVIIAAQGGLSQAISGRVVSKREFAGSWEYLLDEAIFTSPLHPNWSGAAVIGTDDGKLRGIGSLFIQEVASGQDAVPGNMFVPIDILKPIYCHLLANGRAPGAPRPWLGMYTTEALGKLFVTGVSPGGPADEAEIEGGDVVLRVAGEEVVGLADMYRKIWSLGAAGIDVPLSLLREGEEIELVIESRDRRDHLKMPTSH